MELLIYFSRSFVVLFIFFGVYQLFLKNDAHYSVIRWFLLFGLISALLIPLVEINYTVVVRHAMADESFIPVEPLTIDQAVSNEIEGASVKWGNWVLYLYFGIGLLFGLRILVHVCRMVVMAKGSQKLKINGITLCINPKVEMPFVFGRRIFIKDHSYLEARHAKVLVHEKVHLLEQHWIDVFVSELFIVVQWFNPLAWFYARLVKQNLEFIADRGVLKQGFKVDEYIQTIICETMGAEVSVLANHFRFSQNKRRLKMMKNVRKSKWQLLKLLLVLPLLGGLLWSISEPVYAYHSNPEALNDTEIQDEKETFIMKGYVGVNDTMQVRNAETKAYELKIVEGAKPLPGTSVVLKGTTTGTVVGMDGEFEIEAAAGNELVFSFVGYETKIVKIENQKTIKVVLDPTAYEMNPSAFKNRKAPKKSVIKPRKTNDESVFFIVEEMPVYSTGMNLYYNKVEDKVSAIKAKKNLSGRVKVQFVVDEKGELKDMKAISHTDGEEAKYAVKILSELSDWNPGKQRGKPVPVKLVIPVDFK